MIKPTLTIMVGLPASGKSTYVKEKFKDKVILSSDAIRDELFNGVYSKEDNEKVFNTLYLRMMSALNSFEDVVIDATNISVRSRKQILDRVEDIDCVIEAIVMNTPIEECIERNESRMGSVPEEIIIKMSEYFEFPKSEEGFSKIVIIA